MPPERRGDAVDRRVPGAEPLPGYRLIERLGEGGCGEVWKAEGPGGFEVALKFVLLSGLPGAVELRSLEIIKGVRHPNLLAPFGSWQVEHVLIVGMELADRTLWDRLQEAVARGQVGIPGSELIDYLAEAAKGIDHLNEYRHTLDGRERVGVQHRDIKPQNILLVGGGVKVADFGLARMLDRSVAGHSGSVTFSYAAPEFFKGQTSRHSDQYSLAVTYCHLRGGRLPFVGGQAAVVGGHLMKPPDLSMLPEAERSIVARGLAKEPKSRWPNCRSFVEALRSALPTHDSIPGSQAPTWLPPPTAEHPRRSVRSTMPMGVAPHDSTRPASTPTETPSVDALEEMDGLPPAKEQSSTFEGRAAPLSQHSSSSSGLSLMVKVGSVVTFALVVGLALWSRGVFSPRKPARPGALDGELSTTDAAHRVPNGVPKPDIPATKAGSQPVGKPAILANSPNQGHAPIREVEQGPAGAAEGDEDQPDREDVNVLSRRGNAHFDQGDYDQAIRDFSALLRLRPNHPLASFNRGNAYFKKNQFKEAIADYNVVIEQDPNDPEVYNNRGNAYTGLGLYDQAIADYDRAIELKPSDPSFHENRGTAFAHKGDTERSTADYAKADRLKEQSPLQP